MENDGRLGLRWITAQEQAGYVSTMRLMQVIAERDVAVAERDHALAEKKAAISERDSAFLQRDIAVAERDSAIIERDNAMAVLDTARGHKSLGWSQYKRQPHVKGRDATMLQMSLPGVPFSVEEPDVFVNDSSMLGFIDSCEKLQPVKQQQQPEEQPDQHEQQKQQQQQQQQQNGMSHKKETCKTKKDITTPIPEHPKPDAKKKRVENGSRMQEVVTPHILPVVPCTGDDVEQKPQKNELHPPMPESKEYIINTPIPHCSCTGTNQPCYRWGNGGWQSACCTTTLSKHPLPMNPSKKGYRLPGRKMSAGAFQKLVKKLAQEGVDLSQPIDLKNYWAKHGTNRYVIIK